MTIGEFFINIGFKLVGEQKLKDLDKNIRHVERESLKAAVAIDVVTAALLVMIDTSARAAQALQNFVLSTGLSADQLQMWQHTAAVAGVSADELTGSIKTLQDINSQFKLGNPQNVQVWSLLGVDPRQDPFKVLTDLRASLTRFKDIGVVRNLLGQVGLEGLLPILRSTNAEFGKWSQNFIITQRQTDQLAKLNGAWQSIKLSIISVKTQFSSVFAPALEQFFRMMEPVVAKIADFVRWLGTAGPVATFVRWGIIAVAAAVALLGLALTGLTVALGAASIAFGLLDVAAAPWIPIMLVIAGVVAAVIVAIGLLVLELDDLWTFFKGGDSVIGHFGEYFEAGFLWYIREGVKEVNALKNALSTLGQFTSVSGVAGYFAERAAASTPRTGGAAPVTTHNSVEIKIDGAQDPKATGRAVADSLKGVLGYTAYQSPVTNY